MKNAAKCLICVPSKQRPELFHSKTFAILQHVTTPWRVFVEPQDHKAYRNVGVPASNLCILRKDNQGMGYVLNCMRHYALSKGYDWCWKMDDDLQHVYSHSKVMPKPQQGQHIDAICNLLASIDRQLADKLGGLSFPGKGFHTKWQPVTHTNKMFETTYIVRASDWLTPTQFKGYHEEFLASMHLLKQNKVTLRCGALAWTANLSTAPGGLQCFDRVKEQEMYYNRLLAAYPKLLSGMQPTEYTQKDGRVFVVADKSAFNKKFSATIKHIDVNGVLTKEQVRWLSELELSA